MTRTTKIPEIVDHLKTVFAGAAGSDFQIIDGPLLGELMDKAIVIGFSRTPDEAGYSTEIVRMEGLGSTFQEAFEIQSMLTVASGDTDLAPLRSQCGDILGAIDVAMRDQAVVQGMWDRAGLTGDTQWMPLQDQENTAIVVTFSVQGVTFL